MAQASSSENTVSTNSLHEFLASEAALVQEASAALPHRFDSCTHSLGYIRQAVHLCLTCSSPRGLCSACSIACHGDHEQVELFPKRAFRCDCPTSALSVSCNLHRSKEVPNDTNVYGQNFEGKFCRCGRPYNAATEKETMLQCLACEDWYHESCLHLRDKLSANEQDEESDEEDPALLVQPSSYESFICGSCVRKSAVLKKWAGTPGVQMIIWDEGQEKWSVLGETMPKPPDADEEVVVDEPIDISKRPLSPRHDGHELVPGKKARLSGSAAVDLVCMAPVPSPGNHLGNTTSNDDRICLEEPELYEPPEDPDSTLSLEELGLRALQNLPRDKAIEGIRAFNKMRDDLISYLRPFAREGKVVSETDMKGFFEQRGVSGPSS
ncbi:hypothetical protein BS47DRAFT_1373660 [Hydnum rufescens UP504]|uniref:UBR-type domain-containing protein n=1 Tax=Hydnum rufescens UP504 TaxID=1448309 RepID=A0A9P6DSE8_9AGAM|nr:hypothetical protein BS47DRAFT_1373660 [Hydnum rufescens UP504]